MKRILCVLLLLFSMVTLFANEATDIVEKFMQNGTYLKVIEKGTGIHYYLKETFVGHIKVYKNDICIDFYEGDKRITHYNNVSFYSLDNQNNLILNYKQQ